MSIFLKEKIKDIPSTSGVYIFLDDKKEILYIGKATSLKDRVRSYFSADMYEVRGPKIAQMVEKVSYIKIEKTDSVLEALMLESLLIKKHNPYFNTREKDNKSWNYVVITKEELPRIFTMRERELLQKDSGEYKKTFGPFPHGGQLQEALKIIRKIFPFRSKNAKVKGNEEFYRQLKLSPEAKDSIKRSYGQVIRHISMLFEGKKNTIIEQLEKEMLKEAKHERFEDADRIKKKLWGLKHIRDIALLKKDVLEYEKDIRMEAYDVSHLGGSDDVGVMVVMHSGSLEKGEYKKFKIKQSIKGSDTHALLEILERRFLHDEWDMPDVVVIDGGLPQINVAKKFRDEKRLSFGIVSVVKDDKHNPKGFLGDKKTAEKYKEDILLLNAESHRFALAYHKSLRSKRMKK
ncbi:MAG: excinuclease ABC subunit C [Flavobacteriaceae bacterium]|jgi:excinuclease ABC subunit C